jgi:hypothetical protein
VNDGYHRIFGGDHSSRGLSAVGGVDNAPLPARFTGFPRRTVGASRETALTAFLYLGMR